MERVISYLRIPWTNLKQIVRQCETSGSYVIPVRCTVRGYSYPSVVYIRDLGPSTIPFLMYLGRRSTRGVLDLLFRDHIDLRDLLG